MQTNQGGNGTGAAAPAPMSETQIAKMIADGIAAGLASALPIALASHDKAKTERRAAIMGCDEAKEKQKLAASLADNTTMTADEAKAILSAAAKEVPEKKGSGTGFHNAMNNSQNPNVGADGEGNGGNGGDNGGGGESDEDVAARLQQAYVGATGNKVVPIKKAG